MTDEGKQLLNTFETRLRHLIYLHEQQRRENAELKRQIAEQEETRRKMQADYDELNRRYNDLKTATAISPGTKPAPTAPVVIRVPIW